MAESGTQRETITVRELKEGGYELYNPERLDPKRLAHTVACTSGPHIGYHVGHGYTTSEESTDVRVRVRYIFPIDDGRDNMAAALDFRDFLRRKGVKYNELNPPESVVEFLKERRMGSNSTFIAALVTLLNK